jgi:hypothetical protein
MVICENLAVSCFSGWEAEEDSQVMFALAFDRAHSVLHLQLSGIFTSEDMDRFDRLALRFVEANGPVHMLLDFSGTTALAVPATKLSGRGQLPPLCPKRKRVMVMPSFELQAFGRTFGEYQRQAGQPAPLIVESLGEALRALSIDDLTHFEPQPNLVA